MSQTTERPRDDQRQQDERQRERREPSQADKAAMDKAAAEAREAAGAASIGAQIILDYNSDASKGARGGIGTMAENIAARDADLISVGLDPVAPSGPPLGSAEALRKKQEAMAAPRFVPPTSSNATRMSSLAAGVSGENLPEQPPPEGGNGEGGAATAPVNVDVPLVTQSGTTLSATMGNWEGEPTSYSYAWQIDGTDAGVDAADYQVQAGDVGKSATCTVTATNAAGSTAAPASTPVTIA